MASTGSNVPTTAVRTPSTGPVFVRATMRASLRSSLALRSPPMASPAKNATTSAPIQSPGGAKSSWKGYQTRAKRTAQMTSVTAKLFTGASPACWLFLVPGDY